MVFRFSRWLLCSILVFLLIISCIPVPAGAITISQSDSGSASSPSIANGDPVVIQGIATGHPRNGLQVWLIGYNYLKVSTISVNDDNTFSYELKSADTRNLAPGQYFVVVQHPMMNGQFDVVYNSATGTVSNLQLGASGTTIFQLSGSGSLQSPAGAQALIQAISSQNIDDSFTTFSFVISPPAAAVNPIGDHYVGDQFTISGTTNLAAGDNLQVEITSASFVPSGKTSDSSFSGTSRTVQVQAGTGGKNLWSIPVDTSSFRPDEYLVTVSGITQQVTGSTSFRLLVPVVTTPPTPVITATPNIPAITPSTVPITTLPVTQKSPMAFWPVIGAGLLAIIIFCKKK